MRNILLFILLLGTFASQSAFLRQENLWTDITLSPEQTFSSIGTPDYVTDVNAWLDYRDTILWPDQTPFPLTLDQTGTPGTVTVWGSSAIPLILTTNDADSEPVIIAAASVSGSGRVVAIAHDGYISAIDDPTSPKHDVMSRIFEWLGSDMNGGVMISNGDRTVDELKSHAAVGGGILIAMTPWGWKQITNKSIADDLPENQFLAELGMAFTSAYTSASDGVFDILPTNQCRDALINSMMGVALHEFSATGSTFNTEVKTTELDKNCSDIVECSHGGCNSAYCEGGWWAQASRDMWITFDFREERKITEIQITCTNDKARPMYFNLSSADETTDDYTLVESFDFPLKTSENGGTGTFVLSSPLTTQRVKVQLKEIDQTWWMGINDIKFFTQESAILAAHAVEKSNIGSSLPQIALNELMPIVMGYEITDVPCPDNPINKFTSAGTKLRIAMPFLRLTDAAIPGAECWPGIVDAEQHSTVSRDVDVWRVGKNRWFSTHLFLNAGDKATLTLVNGLAENVVKSWKLRIGQHKDNISGKDTWSRWPQISMLKSLDGLETSGSVELSSPFGGLLLFEASVDDAEQFTITISGAYEAPRFIKLGSGEGVYTDGPAPWGEITGQLMSIFLPKSEFEKALAQPEGAEDGTLEAAVEYWDKVVWTHHELAKPPYGAKLERVGPDIQISAGYMHAGFPIGTHMDFAELACDTATLKQEGSWGMFHEFGHNMQRGWWTFSGTGEVTVNLFTLYTMERLLGKQGTDFGFQKKEGQDKVDKYIADGTPIATWKSDAFLALTMYYQLIVEFGWDALKTVFKNYEDDSSLQASVSNDEEMERFMVEYSKVVEKNLAPFFENWGFTITRGNDPDIVDLEPWDVMPATYYQA